MCNQWRLDKQIVLYLYNAFQQEKWKEKKTTTYSWNKMGETKKVIC